MPGSYDATKKDTCGERIGKINGKGNSVINNRNIMKLRISEGESDDWKLYQKKNKKWLY